MVLQLEDTVTVLSTRLAHVNTQLASLEVEIGRVHRDRREASLRWQRERVLAHRRINRLV